MEEKDSITQKSKQEFLTPKTQTKIEIYNINNSILSPTQIESYPFFQSAPQISKFSLTKNNQEKNNNLIFYKRLSLSLIRYINSISLNQIAINNRLNILKEIKTIFKHKYPFWIIRFDGSFSQTLSLKNSDLDLCIFTNGIKPMFSLKKNKKYFNLVVKLLENSKLNIGNIFIKNSLVPIIRTYFKETKIKTEICVNDYNAYKTAQMIKMHITEIPLLRYIIIFLKQLLRCNSLNNNISGGLSSFMIFHFVFAYFQRFCRNKFNIIINIKQSNDKIYKKISELISIGEFLISFLNYFGRENKSYKINLQQNFILEKNITNYTNISDSLISLKNFMNEKEEIGKKCKNFKTVAKIFKITANEIISMKKMNYIPMKSLCKLCNKIQIKEGM